MYRIECFQFSIKYKAKTLLRIPKEDSLELLCVKEIFNKKRITEGNISLNNDSNMKR